MRIPMEKKIKAIVWVCEPFESLGLDGYFGSFNRTYCNTIKHQLVQFVQKAFRIKRILGGINWTFIVLIPKVQQP